MRILATSYRNNIYSMQNKHNNFKGNCFSNNNIGMVKKEIREPILSKNGNITVTNSTTNYEILGKEGNIFISGSTINNLIKTKIGNIFIENQSNVNGSIHTKHGNVFVRDSIVEGDISTKYGSIFVNSSKVTGNLEAPTEIELIDSKVEGTIKTSIDQLTLKGTNILENIIFEDNNSSSSNNVINVSGSGGNCVVISGSNQFVSTSGNGIVIINGRRINPNEIGKDTKPIVPKFTLPKGNTITGTVEFKGEKEGVLILEKGAEFLGELKNGVIKYKK